MMKNGSCSAQRRNIKQLPVLKNQEFMKIISRLWLLGLLFTLACGPSRSLVQAPRGLEDLVVSNPEQATVFYLKNDQQLPIPDGNSSFHQQGVQQLADGGWAVSGSDRETGYLYFADADGSIHTKYTVPTDLKLEGEAAALKYNHPGGFQITDNILAVGIENTDLRKDSYGRVVLLDVSNARAPRHLPHLDIVREAEAGRVMTVGAVGITKREDSYLIAVGNWDSKRFDFYQTSANDLRASNTSVSASLGSWTPGEAGNSYQNFNIYPGPSGTLYAIGLYSVNRSRDWADIFELDISDWQQIRIKNKRSIAYRGGEEDPRFVHAAGSCFDPESSRFLVFSVEAHAHNGVVRGNLWE